MERRKKIEKWLFRSLLAFAIILGAVVVLTYMIDR